MRFPVPSEAFASVDINSFASSAHTISVHCLLPKHKDHDKLFKERHLYTRKFSVYHCDIFNYLFSLLSLFLKPSTLIRCILLLKSNRPPFFYFIKSVLLLPSVYNIYNKVISLKPNVVHLFWGHYPSLLLLLFKDKYTKTKFSMFLGAYDLELGFKYSILMSERVSCVFTHSNYNRDKLISLGVDKNKINVIHRGIKTQSNIVQLVNNKTINIVDPVFLTACRLIKEKGVKDVIRIFNQVRPFFPKSVLYIAGDGPEKQNLEKFVFELGIRDNVFFLGHICQNNLFDLMVKTDFFLLMTYYKGDRLPNVLKEAMYRKCICITTDSRGIRELIRHKENGLVFDTVDQCVKYLSLLNNDNSYHLKHITDRAQNSITKNFNVENSTSKYVKCWKKIVDL